MEERQRRFFSWMKNSGWPRKPHKIARQLATDGDRPTRTPDEWEEGPETLEIVSYEADS